MRFSDLRRGLPAISPNVLSQRMRDLEADGIHTQGLADPPVNSALYELTGRGRSLEPVLTALATWGSRTDQHSTRELSPDALVLALHTTIDPGRPRAVGTFTLHLGADEITVEIEDQAITASRKPAPAPTAIIASDVCTLRAIVFGGHHPADTGIAPHITITGDRPTAHRFPAMFARLEAASTERARPEAGSSERAARYAGIATRVRAENLVHVMRPGGIR
jgi:hypothetical protein